MLPILLSLLLTTALTAPITRPIDLNDRHVCLSQPTLICTFRPTPGHTAAGSAYFTPLFLAGRPDRACVVRITASLSLLPPGPHAFHIHTYGDVSLVDATSLGGHFTNPRGGAVPHGLPADAQRHWGDFGDVAVGVDGVAAYDRVDQVVKIRGIVGRGMVIHEGMDLGSGAQPSGGAGSRLASCVIGIARPDLIR